MAEGCPTCGQAVHVHTGLEGTSCFVKAAEVERDQLRYVGDGLQSAASRMAGYLLGLDDADGSMPYEVHTAALEAQSAFEAWTDARRQAEPLERGGADKQEMVPRSLLVEARGIIEELETFLRVGNAHETPGEEAAWEKACAFLARLSSTESE